MGGLSDITKMISPVHMLSRAFKGKETPLTGPLSAFGAGRSLADKVPDELRNPLLSKRRKKKTTLTEGLIR